MNDFFFVVLAAVGNRFAPMMKAKIVLFLPTGANQVEIDENERKLRFKRDRKREKDMAGDRKYHSLSFISLFVPRKRHVCFLTFKLQQISERKNY